MDSWELIWTRDFFDTLESLPPGKQDEITEKVKELIKHMEKKFDEGFSDLRKTIKTWIGTVFIDYSRRCYNVR